MDVTLIDITSEKDVFDFMNRALHEELPEHVKLVFKNWPKLEIILEGPGYDSTITPSMMRGLVELQESLNRTFAKLVYGHSNAAYLKETDKIELEFKAKVEDGCSHITVNLEKFMESLANGIASKMTPKTVVATVALVAIAYVSDTAVKSHFAAEAQAKEIQAQTAKDISLSQQETARLQIFSDALTKYPEVREVNEQAKRARVEMLKGVSTAESVELNGIRIPREDAKTIVKKERESAKQIQINGDYRILYVDSSRENEIRIKVKFLEDGREFIASFQDDSLDQNQIKTLQTAEWNRSNVYLSVNATELRGEVTTATIISVTQQPLKHT